MKKILLFLFLLAAAALPQQKFYVDLNERTDDLFKVTLLPENLTENNNIFQFASTAPGTYQIMDIGRYVRSFEAYDEEGNKLETKKISANQWELSSPKKIKEIKYTIAETWDTPVDEHPIWRMAGTSIEKDHVLINGQAVFGYFKEKQKDPIWAKLEYPEEWLIGTALRKNSEGYYVAKSYDHIVDSPFLLGRLSKASTKIDETIIEIYTYSKTDIIKSKDILSAIDDILKASSEFMEGLPVDHYTFLFHFEDVSMGAWEHSYSSEYVYKEAPLTGHSIKAIRSTIAHEFFHIITPLNIHSEIIEIFNFEKPVLSQHLWLYEAATEWAAKIMELRSGLVTLDDHLNILKQKLTINDFFEQDVSLKTLSIYATEMQEQYPNIYHKGALIIELLDIRLLELSGGKKGLREVILELSKDYGPERSFSEEDFFDEFVERTYPEIKDFFDKYILSAEPLPIKLYFEKLGIEYFETKGSDSSKSFLGVQMGFENGNFVITNVNSPDPELKKGDIIIKFEDEPFNFQKHTSKIKEYKPGDEIVLTVVRDSNEVKVTSIVQLAIIRHVFEVDEDPTEEELNLRNAWMKNL